jgi:hypothetical protein
MDLSEEKYKFKRENKSLGRKWLREHVQIHLQNTWISVLSLNSFAYDE